MFNQKSFKKVLYNLRKEKGITQEELAFLLGLSSQAVSKWENGQCMPDVTLFPEIANIFNVDVNYLFGINNSLGEKEKSLDFPKVYNNLNFITSYKNNGLYASKEVLEILDNIVNFKDTSSVNLETKAKINVGTGEIIILELDSILENEATINFEFENINSLTLNTSADIEIIKSDSNTCKVLCVGEKKFISKLTCESKEGNLIIENSDNINQNSDKNINKITIEFPSDQGKLLHVKIKGRGTVNSTIAFFEDCKISINGSGIAESKNSDNLDITINGSGIIKTKKTNKALTKINGSGIVEIAKAKYVDSKINGSGDLVFKEIEELGDLSIEINGSGNASILGGFCNNFDIEIHGSGDVQAKNLTANYADIKIYSMGEVVLGRVVKKSKELILKKGIIKILKRG